MERTNIIRTHAGNPDFISLVKLLDAELAHRDGEEHTFYAAYNTIEKIKHVVLVYIDENAVGCGAMRQYAPRIIEIKRMFTLPAYRGKGIASKLLTALEVWAHELSYSKGILETGKNQPEAIGLYHKMGYKLIPNYGPYAGIENSLCFEKILVAVT